VHIPKAQMTPVTWLSFWDLRKFKLLHVDKMVKRTPAINFTKICEQFFCQFPFDKKLQTETIGSLSMWRYYIYQSDIWILQIWDYLILFNLNSFECHSTHTTYSLSTFIHINLKNYKRGKFSRLPSISSTFYEQLFRTNVRFRSFYCDPLLLHTCD